MRRQGYYREPSAVQQPWRKRTGLYLGLVLTVDAKTGTCGVELTGGTQPVPALVVSPNANANNGWIWLPQVGDLVVVGYLDQHASMPVVLGGLYAKNDTLHTVNPGDMTVRHQSGSRLVIAADGTVTITQAAGGAVTMKPTGDIEARHATSGADLLLDSNGVTASQGNVKAQIKTSEVLLDANSAGGGAKVEIFPDGHINITPGSGGVINLGGATTFVARDGDATSPPIGGGVPNHYHTLMATSVKVVAG